MTHLENAVSVTIVRLGKAVPKLFFPSAVDFILQAGRHAAAQLQVSSSCRRYPTLLERQVVDRRQLTGKMKSTALGIGMSGTASPRRTIVLSLAKANSVILGRR